MPQNYTDRIDAASRRLDIAADVAVEKARRELREMKRADALDAEERRERVRKDRERNIEHCVRYDAVFGRHGVRAPQAVADEAPPVYRRRLYALGQSMLPVGHTLIDFDPRGIGPDAIIPLEAQLLQELEREGDQPTGSNRPLSPDDPRARHERVDSMGGKTITYEAKESFIKSLGRPGRKVLRIIDAPRGRVIWGAQFPHTPG
jgi:hypothetical protein